jgi:hypothetical protein
VSGPKKKKKKNERETLKKRRRKKRPTYLVPSGPLRHWDDSVAPQPLQT